MFHIIWMFVVGVVVGLIAQHFVPGAGHLSILMAGIVGIAGSIIGGMISRLFSTPVPGSMFHPAGFIMSIVGSVILLVVWTHLG